MFPQAPWDCSHTDQRGRTCTLSFIWLPRQSQVTDCLELSFEIKEERKERKEVPIYLSGALFLYLEADFLEETNGNQVFIFGLDAIQILTFLSRLPRNPTSSSPCTSCWKRFVQISWLKWELLVRHKVERADSILPGPDHLKQNNMENLLSILQRLERNQPILSSNQELVIS